MAYEIKISEEAKKDVLEYLETMYGALFSQIESMEGIVNTASSIASSINPEFDNISKKISELQSDLLIRVDDFENFEKNFDANMEKIIEADFEIGNSIEKQTDGGN